MIGVSLSLLFPLAGCFRDITSVSPLVVPTDAARRIAVPAESRIEDVPLVGVSTGANSAGWYDEAGIPTGLFVRKGTWLRVTMSGSATLSQNPAYEGEGCTAELCEDPVFGKTVGPGGADWSFQPDGRFGFFYHLFGPTLYVSLPGFPVDSTVYNGVRVPILPSTPRKTDYYNIGKESYIVIDPDPSWTGVAHVPASGELRVLRHGSGRLMAFGGMGVSIQTFTPILLEARAGGASGGTRFVARTSGTPIGVRWTFYEGDTTSVAYDHIESVVSVAGCADQMVCEYAPAKSGRMELTLRLAEAAYHYAISDVIRAESAARLELTCTGPLGLNVVTRGQEITCVASKDPGDAPGDLRITRWSFNNNPRTDSTPASTRWSGIMVRGGTVEVRGVIGTGQEQVKRARISVEKRSWGVMTFQVPQHLVALDPESMSDYPPAGRAFGRFKPRWPDFTKLAIDSVQSGPNTGFSYLHDSVHLPQPIAYVHPALNFSSLPAPLGPSSPGYSGWLSWYNDQNGHPGGSCDSAAINVFRGRVEVHEGVTGAVASHWRVGNRVLNDTKLHERFEALTTDLDTDNLRFLANDMWQRWLIGPYGAAQAQFDTADYPNVFNLGCTLDNNPGNS